MTEKKHPHASHEEEAEATPHETKKHAAKETSDSTSKDATPKDAVRGTQGVLNRLATHLVLCQQTEDAALTAIHDDGQAIVDADMKTDQVESPIAHLRSVHDALFGLSQAVAASTETLIVAEAALKNSLAAKK